MYNYIIFEEIIKEIQSQPDDTYFLIPSDIVGHATSFLKADAAIKRLTYYNNYWKEKGYSTEFAIWNREIARVWICEEGEFGLRGYFKKMSLWIKMQNPGINNHLTEIAQYRDNFTLAD